VSAGAASADGPRNLDAGRSGPAASDEDRPQGPATLLAELRRPPLSATPDTAGTFRLVYRSRSLVEPERRATELGAIFLSARSNNKAQGITGALLVTDNGFVQTLEGGESAVRALYDRIEKDNRHDDVVVLDTRTVDGPVFSRWAMAEVSGGDKADIPLIAERRRGVVPAAGHKTTPEADAVLDFMHENA
jgi:hypothetical protein